MKKGLKEEGSEVEATRRKKRDHEEKKRGGDGTAGNEGGEESGGRKWGSRRRSNSRKLGRGGGQKFKRKNSKARMLVTEGKRDPQAPLQSKEQSGAGRSEGEKEPIGGGNLKIKSAFHFPRKKKEGGVISRGGRSAETSLTS